MESDKQHDHEAEPIYLP